MFQGLNAATIDAQQYHRNYLHVAKIDGEGNLYRFILQGFYDSESVDKSLQQTVRRISEEAIKKSSNYSGMLRDNDHLEFDIEEQQAKDLVRKLSQIPKPISKEKEEEDESTDFSQEEVSDEYIAAVLGARMLEIKEIRKKLQLLEKIGDDETKRFAKFYLEGREEESNVRIAKTIDRGIKEEIEKAERNLGLFSSEKVISPSSSSSSSLSSSTVGSTKPFMSPAASSSSTNLEKPLHLVLSENSPRGRYLNAFLHKLCSAGIGANAVISGKVSASETKSHKGFSYTTSIAAAFVPISGAGVLASKELNDIFGHVEGKKREKRFERITHLEVDPVRFIFFARALTYCLLLCFESGWENSFEKGSEEKTLKKAEKKGEAAADKLIRAVKRKKLQGEEEQQEEDEEELQFSVEMNQAERLRVSMEYLGKKLDYLQFDSTREYNWERILSQATADVLGLPIRLFERSDESVHEEIQRSFEQRLAQLEEYALKHKSEEAGKSVYATFFEDNTAMEGGKVQDVVLVNQSKTFLPDVSEEQRSRDAAFINKIEPKHTRATFAPSGTRLTNVEMSNITLVNQSMDFTGGSGAKQEAKTSPQQSPGHCALSSFPNVSQGKVKAATMKHKHLVTQLAQLIEETYSDEEDRGDELGWLEDFQNRYLMKEEVTQLEVRIQELRGSAPSQQPSNSQQAEEGVSARSLKK